MSEIREDEYGDPNYKSVEDVLTLVIIKEKAAEMHALVEYLATVRNPNIYTAMDMAIKINDNLLRLPMKDHDYIINPKTK